MLSESTDTNQDNVFLTTEANIQSEKALLESTTESNTSANSSKEKFLNPCRWPLEKISTIVDIINKIVLTIAAIIGGHYFRKRKEREKNITFGYLTQFMVYLKGLKQTCESVTNSQICLNYLVNADLDRINSEEAIKLEFLSSEATSLIVFLQNSPDQLSTIPNWTKSYDDLLDLLLTVRRNSDMVHKLQNMSSEECCDYFKEKITTIDNMIYAICKRREKLQKKNFCDCENSQ